MNLRDLARDKACVRCGRQDGTTVLAHYFGPRRHNYGGGMSIKGHDAVGAWLCAKCHAHMDTQSRDKSQKWELSEEFLHLCALTWMRISDVLWAHRDPNFCERCVGLGYCRCGTASNE